MGTGLEWLLVNNSLTSQEMIAILTSIPGMHCGTPGQPAVVC